MKIGIPKEIKNNENRVGMTPAGVAEFIRHGHEVMVQHTAGENSGFADEEYMKVGAKILPDIQSVYREAEMIVKVKEPIAEEYPLIHQDQLVFTYFHFACDKELTDAMIKSGAVCLAYETVETDNHHLPLLIPSLGESIYSACGGYFDDGLPVNEVNALTLVELLRAWTAGGAYDLMREDELGTLEVGKLADICVLDRDVFDLDYRDARDLSVDMTMSDGQIVFDRNKEA